jgi:mannosylglycerate hydrolase
MVKIVHTLNVPSDTDVNSRSKEYAPIKIETFVSVNRHEDRIDIKTVIDNTVKNHRIRALFETGLQTETHVADQQFGTIRRDNDLPQVEYWEQEQWEEKYYPIYPQQKYVDVSDQEKGLSILNKGLPQYEILNGQEPVIALTLLSGTDYMGKQDLVDRPGRRSGLHVETPDSSLLGIHEMEYSIIPHKGNEVDAKIGMKANEYTASMLAVQVNHDETADPMIQDRAFFFRVDHTSMAVSAMKKCEKDDSIIVRIYNTTDQEIPFAKAAFNTAFFKKAEMVDLNEAPLEEDGRIQISQGEIGMKDISSNEVLSFKLYR